MRVFRVFRSLILLAVFAYPAFPAIRPSFNLDYSSWHATHIVLAITTSVEGTFEVIESWKGDLRVGERLVVPELRPTANVPISGYPRSLEASFRGGVSELIPKEPPGSRMVLFLKSSTDEQAQNSTLKTERHGWKSSDGMDAMKASAVWINGDELYGFAQIINPGPSVLSKLPYSEAKLRSRVQEIDDMQANITAALAAKDGAERAERLKPYARSDVFPAQQIALKELAGSGLSGVGVIRGMLDDPAFADEASELVKALVEAGGETVGAELNIRLRRDLAFWKSRGPSLSVGWWNEDTSIHAPLRERYDQTYQLILGLEVTHYSAAVNTVVELRDFWRSLPQLNDPRGLNELADECDKLIAKLKPD